MEQNNSNSGTSPAKISLPFAFLSCIVSAVFSVGVFYATVENRLKNLETGQGSYIDVRERVIRIETKMDILLKTEPK